MHLVLAIVVRLKVDQDLVHVTEVPLNLNVVDAMLFEPKIIIFTNFFKTKSAICSLVIVSFSSVEQPLSGQEHAPGLLEVSGVGLRDL